MLDHYLGGSPEDGAGRAFYFGGHRPVSGLYTTRAAGRYVQFHNPGKQIVAVLEPEGEIDPDRAIREIEIDASILTHSS